MVNFFDCMYNFEYYQPLLQHISKNLEVDLLLTEKFLYFSYLIYIPDSNVNVAALRPINMKYENRSE